MRRLFALLAVVTASLIACSTSQQTLTSTDTAELPIAPAWLASRVPDNALAYARIPSILGLTSGPKGNALSPMMQSDAHVEWLNTILAGLTDNVAAQPGFESPIIQWVVRHQRSPIEWLLSPVPGAPNTAPGVTIAMQTDLDSNDAMSAALSGLLGEFIPGASMPSGFSDDGIGAITGLPVPAIASFDPASSRLLIISGAGATVERMAAARDALEDRVTVTPMSKMEARIDESGYGLFAWINTRNALSMAQMFIPPSVMEPVIASGLDQAESIAFGYGVSRGKTRMGFYADVPQGDGMRSLIPVPQNELQLKTTAPPKLVSVLAFPPLQDVKAIVMATGTVTEDEWREYAQQASDYLGTDAEALYDLATGEFLYVQEAVGSYGALKIDSSKKMDAVVTQIAEKFDLTFNTRSIRGLDIRYWKLPGGPSDSIDDSLEKAQSAPALRSLVDIYTRIGSHLFWIYEDGYMVFGSAPQVLIDRQRRRPKTTLADWAENTAKQELSNSLLGLSASVDGLPRFAHQTYIASMPFLSDIAGIELDVWSLPTADDLNLPEQGALAFNIVTGDDVLGAEFSFEHSPFDTLGGAGGVVVVGAVGGILAGIAVPAYQDYTLRAQVGEALAAAQSAKFDVQQFFFDNGRYPNAEEAALMGYDFGGSYATEVLISPDTGWVTVYMNGMQTNPILQGASIRLSPELTADGDSNWQCDTTIDQRYLPSICRY